MTNRQFFVPLWVSLVLIFLWSIINPHDLFTWFLEVFPVIAGVIVLLFTYSNFKFTRLAYFLLWCHAIILMIGGHYTYAEVPFFNWLKDAFELSRNHYDRVGHLAQGFFPAIIAREILLRTSPLRPGKWLFVLVICVCLSFSAFYELIEWWVAVSTGTAAEAFLGTQGDIWDTQWDMALALSGAIISLLVLGKIHDTFLENIKGQGAEKIPIPVDTPKSSEST
jgi:putative membrane protein